MSEVDKLNITALLVETLDFDVAYANSRTTKSRREATLTRPAPSPERLRCQFYLGEMLIVSAEAFSALGGFRSDRRGAAVYDLVLRASRSDAKIVHIDRVLFTSPRSSQLTSDWCLFGDVNLERVGLALSEHLDLTGGGQVRRTSPDGVHDTRRLVRGNPLVSIVIPTRARLNQDGSSYIIQALDSVTRLSTYSNFEIVLVIDHDYDDSVFQKIRQLCKKHKLIEVFWDKPFNFSDKINLGAVSSNGEFILVLNDDVEVISPDWIQSLLALAQLNQSGMSGAMLYFEDDSIQHAGHAYRDGEVSHVGLDEPRSAEGPLRGYKVEREICGVTAACCMIPRKVFFEVGGFTGLLPGAFNDVDFSLKVSGKGFEIYWTPHAELYHFESKSRDASVRGFEVETLRRRWGHRLLEDPYWPYPFSRPSP